MVCAMTWNSPHVPGNQRAFASRGNSIGITQIPRDFKILRRASVWPWDPHKDGKSVVRASYGMFYDHPPLACFDSDVADGPRRLSWF
jgi:hypothetical protein